MYGNHQREHRAPELWVRTDAITIAGGRLLSSGGARWERQGQQVLKIREYVLSTGRRGGR